MERLEQARSWDQSLPLYFYSDKTSGNVVLKVEEATVGYDDQILSRRQIWISVRQIRTTVVGPNGIGKSTLISLLIGRFLLSRREKPVLGLMSGWATMTRPKVN